MGGADGDGPFVGTEDCLYLDITAPINKTSIYCQLCFGFMVVAIHLA